MVEKIRRQGPRVEEKGGDSGIRGREVAVEEKGKC